MPSWRNDGHTRMVSQYLSSIAAGATNRAIQKGFCKEFPNQARRDLRMSFRQIPPTPGPGRSASRGWEQWPNRVHQNRVPRPYSLRDPEAPSRRHPWRPQGPVSGRSHQHHPGLPQQSAESGRGQRAACPSGAFPTTRPCQVPERTDLLGQVQHGPDGRPEPPEATESTRFATPKGFRGLPRVHPACSDQGHRLPRPPRRRARFVANGSRTPALPQASGSP